jgi:hypothetical protein
MPRASVVAALLALTVPLFSVRAAADTSTQAKKPQSPPESKAETRKGEVSSLSRDRAKEILRDVLKQIRSMDEAAAKSKSELDPLSSARMAMRTSAGLQAQTVAAIAGAQAKLGDLVGAKSTWQTALDSAGEINLVNGQIERGAK